MEDETRVEATQTEAQQASAAADTGGMTFDQWLDSNPAFRSEFDRRATKAVNTARANWEREQTEFSHQQLQESGLLGHRAVRRADGV